MNIDWDNQKEKIYITNFPGFKIYAQELDKFFLRNFKNPLIQEVFESSKWLEAEKIEGIVSIETIFPAPQPGVPQLLSYDFEFLLCLEYIFLMDKEWQECEVLASLFELAHDQMPASEMGYDFLANYLKTCYEEKRDLTAILV